MLCFVGSDVGNIMLYNPFDLKETIPIAYPDGSPVLDKNSNPLTELTPVDSMCCTIGLSQDEQYIVTGSRRGTLRIIEVKNLM